MQRIWPSKHFADQWADRVGGPVPSPDSIGRIVAESVFCQKQRDLYTPRGKRYRVLAVYWHPERDLILKIDEETQKAVTVLTPDTRDRPCRCVGF